MLRSSLLAALLLIGCTARSQIPPAGLSCIWTPRDSIRLNRGYAYLESPRAVVLGDTAVLISHQAIERTLSGRVTLQSPANFLLAGIELGDGIRGHPVALPGGVGRLSRPRAAAMPRGSVEVVWQGGMMPDDTLVSRLWTATLDRGTWSKPALVGNWRVRDLGINASSDLVAQGESLGLVVVGMDDSTFLYTRVKGAWQRRALTGEALYASLALVEGGFMMAAVDHAGLAVWRVEESVRPGAGILVASTTEAGIHFPVLLADSGRLTLAWVEGVGLRRSVVRIAFSTDAGRRWTQGPRLVVDGGLESLDAVLDAEGRAHIAGRGSGLQGPWPFVAMLNNDAWRLLPIQQNRGELGIVPPRFSRRPGSPEVLWGVVTESGLDSEPPMLARVRVRADCPR